MNAPRKGDQGFYHPIRQIECGYHYSPLDTDCVAVVVGVNYDDSLNLVVWTHDGKQFVEHGVPVKENADDGVAYFEARE
jgi:hypothetical protein